MLFLILILSEINEEIQEKVLKLFFFFCFFLHFQGESGLVSYDIEGLVSHHPGPQVSSVLTLRFAPKTQSLYSLTIVLFFSPQGSTGQMGPPGMVRNFFTSSYYLFSINVYSRVFQRDLTLH